MREFTVNLSKSLMKGLTPFQDQDNSDEPLLQGLEECFNLMPTETGLESHRALLPIGWSDGGFFNYLPIRDQNGELWYWYPVFDGHILSGPNVPSEPSTGLQALPIVASPVEWIEIPDETGAVWKLYPDIEDGFTRATDSTILYGVGLSYLQWKGTTTEWWTVRFRLEDHTRYAVKL